MRAIRLFPCLLAIALLAALPTMALYDPNEVSYRTNTANASCASYEEEDSSWTTACHENSVWVKFNSERGCIRATGGAQCVYGSYPSNTNTDLYVTCPDGWKFEISTGNNNTDGHCDFVKDENQVVIGGHCGNGTGTQETNKVDVDCSLGYGQCETPTGTATCTPNIYVTEYVQLSQDSQFSFSTQTQTTGGQVQTFIMGDDVSGVFKRATNEPAISITDASDANVTRIRAGAATTPSGWCLHCKDYKGKYASLSTGECSATCVYHTPCLCSDCIAIRCPDPGPVATTLELP